MVLKYSEPLSVTRTAYVNLRPALDIMKFAINPGNDSHKAFEDAVIATGVLELVREALSKPEVSFKKPKLCEKAIEAIGEVVVAAVTNSRSPSLIKATNLSLAEEYVRRSLKTTSPSELDRGYRYDSIDLEGNIKLWRVLEVAHEFGSIIAFFPDSIAEDYVPPNTNDPADDCGFHPSETCDEDDDSDDECESIQKKCLSNFRPAC